MPFRSDTAGETRAFLEGIVVYAGMALAGVLLLIFDAPDPVWMCGLGGAMAILIFWRQSQGPSRVREDARPGTARGPARPRRSGRRSRPMGGKPARGTLGTAALGRNRHSIAIIVAVDSKPRGTRACRHTGPCRLSRSPDGSSFVHRRVGRHRQGKLETRLSSWRSTTKIRVCASRPFAALIHQRSSTRPPRADPHPPSRRPRPCRSRRSRGFCGRCRQAGDGRHDPVGRP